MFDTRRLRRTHWTADLLADEVRAILDSATTEGVQPFRVLSNGTEPPITFEMPDVGQPPPGLQYTIGGTQYTIAPIPGAFNPVLLPDVALPPLAPGVPPVVPPPFTAAPPVGGLLPPPWPPPPPPSPGSPPTLPPPSGGSGGSGGSPPDPAASGDSSAGETSGPPVQLPFTTIGVVVSGTGKNYVLDVWLSDPGPSMSEPPWARLPATCQQFDGDDRVPAGTVVYVTVFYAQVGAARAARCRFQVPVWLGE